MLRVSVPLIIANISVLFSFLPPPSSFLQKPSSFLEKSKKICDFL